MTPARREWLLSAAAALWGLAIAMALASLWDQRAPAGQLPGLATKLDFDARAPFRWVAGLMLLPVLVPLLLRPVLRRLAADDTRVWARNAVMVAPLVAFWFATITRSVPWVLVPAALVLAAATLLRHVDLAFTRHDAVLLLVLLTTLLGVIDAFPSLGVDRCVVVAALLVLALRIAVRFLPSPLPPALAFLAAPLALILQTSFFARSERYAGWPVLAIVVVTPFVLRLLLKDRRRALGVLAFAVYPLALYSYTNAVHLTTAEGKPRVMFFEDGHALLPASEYLRGELPYRDIVPGHGLIEDGLFDYGALLVDRQTYGTPLRARFVAGCLNAVALYAIVFAATASAEAALLAVLFGVSAGLITTVIRPLAAAVTMIFLVLAARTRQPRWMAWAGFFTVVTGLMSFDYGAYTLATLVVATIRFRRAWKHAAIGVVAGVVPLFATFAALGILDDFFHAAFREVLSLRPVWVLTIFTPPDEFTRISGIPELLAAVLDREALPFVVWIVAAIVAGVTVTRRAGRRLEPLVLMSVWMVFAALSYANRHHLYFTWLIPAFLIGGVWHAVRRRMTLAPAAVLLAVMIAAPTIHIAITNWLRHTRGPLDPAWAELTTVPRARGVLMFAEDRAVVTSVQKYLSLALAPGETFFDFTNRPVLYFLFGRDCPIRYYEVPYYETEERQRAVIATLEANRRVRAVLVPGPAGAYTFDGVTNRERAPLVWQYLESHFHPDFEEGEVVFWRR